MSKIYVGQTKLTLRVNVQDAIPNVETAEIRYRKPKGETGSFPAEVEDEVLGIIRYDIEESTDIDTSGMWLVWAYLTYTDGKVIAGEAAPLRVFNQGE